MIICFEGPDCAGKTTQAQLLVDHIKNNYSVPVQYKHFPDMNEDIKRLVMTSNNPFFNACAFIFDMACTMKTNDFRGTERILVLDRYYFSSLIMCTEWKNKYDSNPPEREEYDNYLKTIFGFTGMTLQKIELPPPDLTFVIMPDYSIFKKRLAAKTGKDPFETDTKRAEAFYKQYQSAIQNLSLFKMNSEPLPPVIIRDTAMVENDDYGMKVMSAIRQSNNALPGNQRSIKEISSAIQTIFDNYMEYRHGVATKNITDIDNDLKEIWRNDNPSYLTKGTSQTQTPSPKDQFPDPIATPIVKVGPIDPPVKQPKSLIQEDQDMLQTIHAIASGDALNEDARIRYKLNDTQYYIYLKLDLDPKAILNKWNKLKLTDEYCNHDRLLVLETMIKILDNENTRDNLPNAKINEVIRDIRKEIESIGKVDGDGEQ